MKENKSNIINIEINTQSLNIKYATEDGSVKDNIKVSLDELSDGTITRIFDDLDDYLKKTERKIK